MSCIDEWGRGDGWAVRVLTTGSLALAMGVASGPASTARAALIDDHSVARVWNEQILGAVRNDTARPTIHARNLFHVSAAMFDAWAAYDDQAMQVYHQERATATDVDAARREAISYAAYRILRHRFVDGPGGTGPGRFVTAFDLNQQMFALGYNINVTSTEGDSPAALGNRIAQSVIAHGLADGANEPANYAIPAGMYQTVNPPLVFDQPGIVMNDPNRWQPLQFLRERRDQFGQVITQQVQGFLSPYWGEVSPFAITPDDRSANGVYHDQGAPPQLGGVGDARFREDVVDVIRRTAELDPTQGQMIDISPAVKGNAAIDGYVQTGHSVNPYTGLPYEPNIVNLGDWGRMVAEFWADGPLSSAPPGHWNEIANAVTDKMEAIGKPKQIGGTGQVLDQLEWDVKLYLALNGAVHDAAVATWNHKGVYDGARPISMIRYMGQLGQSSDPDLMVEVGDEMVSTYHPDGLPLEDGLIEVITPQTTAPGGKHEHLAGHEGKMAVMSWRGAPPVPRDAPEDFGGVGWILAEMWMPYQQDDFVTPPFAGYTSGHSTFSRAAATVLMNLTGDAYFPGGIFEWFFPEGEGLEFEYGPSADLTFQWATYFDAADEAGISRIFGGIHPSVDDLGGRQIGALVGAAAWDMAMRYYLGTIPEPASGMLLLLAGAGLLGRRRR